MIIFLFGENKYFIDQKIKEITEDYKKKHKSGLNFLKLDASDLEFEEFKNKIETMPIFKEKKFVILENFFKNKIFKDDFHQYIKKSDILKDKEIILLIYEIFSDKEKAKQAAKEKLFLELTKPPVVFKEYDNLGPKQLEEWVVDIVKKDGVIFEKSALNLFLGLVPSDNLHYVKEELDKLTLYSKSNENMISKKSVEELIGDGNIYQNIFQAMDYLGEKKKKEAISLIHKLIKGGKNEIFILAIIVGQIRNLIKVRSMIDQGKPYSDILKKTKIHPFVLQKAYRQAQKFSLADLKNLYLLLFETDLNIKTGKVDPGLAIDLLVSKI